MNLTLQTKDVTFSLFYVPKSHTDKLYRNSDRKWVDIEHFKIVIMEHKKHLQQKYVGSTIYKAVLPLPQYAGQLYSTRAF